MNNFFLENEKNLLPADDKLLSACDGLFYISETDAPLSPFKGAIVDEVKADTIVAHFGVAPSRVEEISLDEFFKNLTTDQEWYGEAEKKIATRFRELRALLEEDLRDLKVFRFGSIQIDVFVAGIDREGHLGGVRTNAVET